MNQLKAKAERLRESGYSYSMINEKLGVSKSTQSYWFKDKPFTPNKAVLTRVKYGPIENGKRRHNKRVQETTLLKKLGEKELGILTKRDIWMLGLGLYIGEGAKTTEQIRISNSDPDVIKIAISWLKDACYLNESNISVRLHLYPDNDLAESLAYWQKITNLPASNFSKPYIDNRTNKIKSRRGVLPHGTAHISVVSRGDKSKGVKLYRRINGWMTGSLNQVNS